MYKQIYRRECDSTCILDTDSTALIKLQVLLCSDMMSHSERSRVPWCRFLQRLRIEAVSNTRIPPLRSPLALDKSEWSSWNFSDEMTWYEITIVKHSSAVRTSPLPPLHQTILVYKTPHCIEPVALRIPPVMSVESNITHVAFSSSLFW